MTFKIIGIFYFLTPAVTIVTRSVRFFFFVVVLFFLFFHTNTEASATVYHTTKTIHTVFNGKKMMATEV